MSRPSAPYQQIHDNPRFQALVARRNRHALGLTLLVLILYFAYILALAFAPDWLARRLGPGMTMTLGMPLGLGIIAVNVVLTAFYVRRANRDFDREAAEVRKEACR